MTFFSVVFDIQVHQGCLQTQERPHQCRDINITGHAASAGVGQTASLPTADHVLGLCLHPKMQLFRKM